MEHIFDGARSTSRNLIVSINTAVTELHKNHERCCFEIRSIRHGSIQAKRNDHGMSVCCGGRGMALFQSQLVRGRKYVTPRGVRAASNEKTSATNRSRWLVLASNDYAFSFSSGLSLLSTTQGAGSFVSKTRECTVHIRTIDSACIGRWWVGRCSVQCARLSR